MDCYITFRFFDVNIDTNISEISKKLFYVEYGSNIMTIRITLRFKRNIYTANNKLLLSSVHRARVVDRCTTSLPLGVMWSSSRYSM